MHSKRYVKPDATYSVDKQTPCDKYKYFFFIKGQAQIFVSLLILLRSKRDNPKHLKFWHHLFVVSDLYSFLSSAAKENHFKDVCNRKTAGPIHFYFMDTKHKQVTQLSGSQHSSKYLAYICAYHTSIEIVMCDITRVWVNLNEFRQLSHSSERQL